ncbi:Planctomycete cytochrome C [Singulisphaera sp. GP187]|uniref:DUF1553 domain-containing protein n=1 Tax=Singulisphaera sp. GP187 TaxID=1882752 RepID=UPI0009260F0A|nr:DUF1553 domain-containing protein [Singulisphaera sp. GP187]SIN81273.1 Planctomycete cytochrome C [Singulisphaera sp. GP187]
MTGRDVQPFQHTLARGGRRRLWVGQLGFTIAVLFTDGIAMAEESPVTKPVDFAREIRPILAEHCWTCHGPDEAARKAKLRLDRRESAVALEAIVPGDVEASALIERIESEDDADRMPPPAAKKDLNPSQKRLLRNWVAQGAEYSQHWAFVPPKRPEIPALRGATGVKNPIDHFIRHRLEHEGLKPAPEADRLTLLRRVTLDLTGLPPTLDEQNAFLADSASDAYERVVDRLLASPRYAERMAMTWLDAARYADTNGYNNDEDRTMWPWRDWVIHAFQRNQPYDQFITEQLAGDLLPTPTLEQKVASGFHRNQGHNTEGGIIPEEYRVEYVADRVHATATVFLGLSLQCARCHDHKYDPFSQKEYYQFYGFFNSLDEKQGGYGGAVAIEPYLQVPSDSQSKRLAEIKDQRQALLSQIARQESEAELGRERWERDASPTERDEIKQAGLKFHFALDETEGELVGDAVNSRQPGSLRGMPRRTTGKLAGALEFADQTYVDLGERGTTDGQAGFSVGCWIRPDSSGPMAILSKMDEEAGYRGYDILWENGRVACHLIHHWPDNGLKVVTKDSVKPKEWRHVLVTYDGSRKAAGIKIYLDGKLSPVEVANDNLTGTIATEQPLRLGLRQKSLPFNGGLDDLRGFGVALDRDQATTLATGKALEFAGDILAVPGPKRTPEQRAQLRRFFLDRIDRDYARLKSELADLDRSKDEFEKTLPIAMVMRDLSKPRETFILKRGQYDLVGDPVEPNVPSVFQPMAAEAPRNRLGLARWMTDPAHPLTARVAVNRWWEMYFGTGLVKTVEDFGAMGELPSHPDLLDYLATEFIRTGWNVKAMQQLIVTSAAYRQASRATPEILERDPENRLIARGPRFRLPAETVRDNALAISGLLRGKVGGPSVKPYQPEGLWEEVSVERKAKYVPDDADGLYRRSMYTFWKRTCPPPALMNFDATNREVCVVRRGRTNTPLQALILLNDPTYLEAARKLAERMLEAGSSFQERLELGYRLAASRSPRAEERAILTEIYHQAFDRFRNDRTAAETLLTVGKSPRNPAIEPAELAAWTVTCSTILNLDEVISKR